jgi:hypothetical protein
MKTCVYVRCIDESHFLNAFVEHYLNLGFDMIYVLYEDTKNVDYKLPEDYTNFVTMKNVSNIGDLMLDRYKDIIDDEIYKWTLIVDIDEFLILNSIFSNITDVIDFYKNINKKVNIIQFGWIWSHKFSMNMETVKDILSTRKLLIGKQGNEDNIWYKSMIKSKYLVNVGKHISILRPDKKYIVGYNKKILSVKGGQQPDGLKNWISWADNNNLRNHPIDDNTYKDGFILHITTRNICDVLAKALSPAIRDEKKIKDLEYIESIFYSDIDIDIILDDDFLISLVEKLGYRLKFPLRTLHFGQLNNKKVFSQITIPRGILPLCSDMTIEEKMNQNMIIALSKRFDKYFFP